jgi:hypothetical protein
MNSNSWRVNEVVSRLGFLRIIISFDNDQLGITLYAAG